MNSGVRFGNGAGHDRKLKSLMLIRISFWISIIVDPGLPPASECSLTTTSSTRPATTTSSLAKSTNSRAGNSTPIAISSFLEPLYSTISSHQTTLTASVLNVSATIPGNSSPTTSLSTMVSAPQFTLPLSFWQRLSLNAKIGSILGLTLLILILLLSILLFIRHKRHSQSLASRSISISPELPIQSPPPSPSPASSQISTLRRDSTERSRVGRRGGLEGCRSPPIIVIETEGKNSIDSQGIRWPDEVVLTGEAKDMREWSLGYGLDKSRRAKSGERTR
ncbi:hypothetical protein N431DRAFT_418774 [Stipitochalara longipes BDJ]|nr:hypothetical protein N431DRAFT_418774 [Stipitochalara longipes BDJ]